tara:strand:+ start:1043 stop:1360 length:318 start_codon:yes stop_codon:yes gene_type:complete
MMNQLRHAEYMKQMAMAEDAGKEAYGNVDIVNQPAHYARFNIEPITFIMENDLPFYKGNCIKYVCRAGHKQYEGMTLLESEKKDIEKMIRYGQMRINQIDGRDVL